MCYTQVNFPWGEIQDVANEKVLINPCYSKRSMLDYATAQWQENG